MADDCKRIPNILVLFDASGYMRNKGLYETLIQQMNFFSQAFPLTADGFFNVGLRHYGLKVGIGLREHGKHSAGWSLGSGTVCECFS